jgi:hypothetical protein
MYLHKFKKQLATCYFVTHEDGDKPNYKGYEATPWELLGNLDYWVDANRQPWIMNIDLDYFFCDDREDDNQQMISDDYVRTIFSAVNKTIRDGHVGVTTIALSPEFCGGWGKSERIMEIVLAELGINFKLPI